MDNPFTRKLEHFAKLSLEDRRTLAEVVGERVRHLGPREDVVREGAKPRNVNLFLEGWACRYKTLEDGRRQITSFFLPGDLCDLNVFILREMDHSIGTITPVKLAEISRERLSDITARHPRITQALWWETLVDAATQREWTLNVGQRSALERMAHLICELFLRLRCVGLTTDHSCELPVTQAELADATGLSTVHVNRTLKQLRGEGLIELRGKRLTILDLDRLRQAALFNENYLHLAHEGRHLDANEG
jgi:CRP-like cAMP-binding protein